MEENKPLTPEEVEKVSDIVESLFTDLEIAGSFKLEEVGQGIEIIVDSEDNAMLIGYHGEILEALQLILSLVVAKKLDKFTRVTLEIGDYRKNRSAYLEKLAMQVKERVLAEQREQTIPQLKSWERRVVHLLLQDDKEVVSESMGEGKERVLVVRPRE